MKFCYIDESGTSDGRLVVAVAIVVDASRMHLMKAEWSETLLELGNRLGVPLREFKAKELYGGNGPWKGFADRAGVISDLVDTLRARKHEIVFSGALGSRFDSSSRPERNDLPDLWCAADRHLLLAVQRRYQRLGAKGYTVTVFDHGKHDEHLANFVRDPESWTDDYYQKPRSSPRLSHIVDVPYFVDSSHAVLVQTADLCAYILRRHVELTDLGDTERYTGERDRVMGWARLLASRAPRGDIYPARSRNVAHELFRELAPPSLATLRP